MIYEEQLPWAIWTRNFRKHILCEGTGSVGALPGRRRAVREQEEGGTGRQNGAAESDRSGLSHRNFGQNLLRASVFINFYMLCCLV